MAFSGLFPSWEGEAWVAREWALCGTRGRKLYAFDESQPKLVTYIPGSGVVTTLSEARRLKQKQKQQHGLSGNRWSDCTENPGPKASRLPLPAGDPHV